MHAADSYEEQSHAADAKQMHAADSYEEQTHAAETRPTHAGGSQSRPPGRGAHGQTAVCACAGSCIGSSNYRPTPQRLCGWVAGCCCCAAVGLDPKAPSARVPIAFQRLGRNSKARTFECGRPAWARHTKTARELDF
eukprot:64370-Prymnesium_polylepis.2